MISSKHMSLTTTASRPPGPARGLPGRYLLALRRRPLDFLLTMAQRYGDIVSLPLGRKPIILLNHPDFVRQALNNEQVQPVGRQFLPAGCEGWAGIKLTKEEATFITDEAVALSRSWQEGAGVDIVQVMTRLSLRIALRTLFTGGPVYANSGPLQRTLDALIDSGNPCDFTLGFWASRHKRHLRAQLEALVSSLLPITTQELSHPEDELTQVIGLLLAAYEVPANVLVWTFYLLARHPQVGERLRLELTEVLGGRRPTARDLSHLRFTSMVWAETMRLYPPHWAISRRVRQALQIGGYTISAGTTLLLSPWVIHHDSRYFSEPFAFLPERWQANFASFPYFPCGDKADGSRDRSFLWSEGILLLATLAQRWQLGLSADHAMMLRCSLTLRPRHGLLMMPSFAEVTP